MIKAERVGIVSGFYLDPAGNGYKVVDIAENERSGERVVVYRKVMGQGETTGKLLFLPVGTFESETDCRKGFKYFSRWPRVLGLLSKPGSRINKKV